MTDADTMICPYPDLALDIFYMRPLVEAVIYIALPLFTRCPSKKKKWPTRLDGGRTRRTQQLSSGERYLNKIKGLGEVNGPALSNRTETHCPHPCLVNLARAERRVNIAGDKVKPRKWIGVSVYARRSVMFNERK